MYYIISYFSSILSKIFSFPFFRDISFAIINFIHSSYFFVNESTICLKIKTFFPLASSYPGAVCFTFANHFVTFLYGDKSNAITSKVLTVATSVKSAKVKSLPATYSEFSKNVSRNLKPSSHLVSFAGS